MQGGKASNQVQNALQSKAQKGRAQSRTLNTSPTDSLPVLDCVVHVHARFFFLQRKAL
jgi:hypothetical protein